MKYDTKELAEFFSYQRCADSAIEKEFIRKYIDSKPGMRRDSFGNRFIKVGKTETAFTSHTDTVHNFKCGRQKVYMQEGWAFTTSGYCLGGDDGTGIWLMLNMIYANVPGLYIFHREEESGGQGSNYVVNNAKNMVSGIKRMIALDRKGYGDVITHQGWQQTCSDKFAKALANQLGGKYKPCDGGVFCDSANYTDLIPECTNLSIGYFNAHSEDEIQDLSFARQLFHKLKRVRWESLPTERTPGVKEYKGFFSYSDFKPYKPAVYKEWGYGDYRGYGLGHTTKVKSTKKDDKKLDSRYRDFDDWLDERIKKDEKKRKKGYDNYYSDYGVW